MDGMDSTILDSDVSVIEETKFDFPSVLMSPTSSRETSFENQAEELDIPSVETNLTSSRETSFENQAEGLDFPSVKTSTTSSSETSFVRQVEELDFSSVETDPPSSRKTSFENETEKATTKPTSDCLANTVIPDSESSLYSDSSFINNNKHHNESVNKPLNNRRFVIESDSDTNTDDDDDEITRKKIRYRNSSVKFKKKARSDRANRSDHSHILIVSDSDDYEYISSADSGELQTELATHKSMWDSSNSVATLPVIDLICDSSPTRDIDWDKQEKKKSSRQLRSINQELSKWPTALKPRKMLASRSQVSSSQDITSLDSTSHNKQSSLTMEVLDKLHRGLAPLENPDKVNVSGLKVELLPHQTSALSWLIAREREVFPSGGILADDMGLGKTFTMIALILNSKQSSVKTGESDSESDSDEEQESRSTNQNKGKTLVLCPVSVAVQWENEIRTKVVAGLLTSIIHHGPKRETRPHRLCHPDIVISTYSILQKDNKEDLGPLLNIYWKRIVLDEAHLIRNYKTQTSKAVFLLKGKHRWCLTGTPVQNKSMDLYSLLKFLKCRPFNDLNVWNRWVDNKDAAGAHRLSCIIKSILLRRTKAEITTLDLKKKHFNLVKFKLDPEEMAVYEKVAQLSGAIFAQFIQQKAEKENLLNHGMPVINRRNPHNMKDNPFVDHPELERLYGKMLSLRGVQSVQILLLLLRLRQFCCHPSLITKMLDNDDLETASGEVVEKGNNELELVEKMMRVSLMGSQDDDNIANYDDVAACANSLSKSNPIFNRERISSKVRHVMDYLIEKVVPTDDKALIISQFTTVLDIIEVEIKKLKVKYCFLTGKTKVSDRGNIMAEFNTPSRGPRVMLLSLVAGGTGLNLVGANHLLFVDVHWNPQLENQAFDRVYRIGQTKDVFIHKFICEDTIEERVLNLQASKLELAENLLTGSSHLSSTKLTIHDLKMLFSVK